MNRWDWEPYGLVFCRQSLCKLGARPVTYGDEALFAKLPREEHPFFQPFGKDSLGWQVEQEWRLLGDLNLRLLPRLSVAVFVRSEAEAVQLSRASPWPVLWVT